MGGGGGGEMGGLWVAGGIRSKVGVNEAGIAWGARMGIV